MPADGVQECQTPRSWTDVRVDGKHQSQTHVTESGPPRVGSEGLTRPRAHRCASCQVGAFHVIRGCWSARQETGRPGPRSGMVSESGRQAVPGILGSTSARPAGSTSYRDHPHEYDRDVSPGRALVRFLDRRRAPHLPVPPAPPRSCRPRWWTRCASATDSRSRSDPGAARTRRDDARARFVCRGGDGP